MSVSILISTVLLLRVVKLRVRALAVAWERGKDEDDAYKSATRRINSCTADATDILDCSSV